MAEYKISGVWKNTDNTITHYAIHQVGESSASRAVKTTKSDAVRLLGIAGNEAVTWLWSYTQAGWVNGAKVEVVDNQYLRSHHDGKLSNNLAHLIDYDWLSF